MDPLAKKKKKTFSSDAIKTSLNNSSSTDYYTPPNAGNIAPAAAQALQLGADPGILNKAKQYLGNKDFTNLCERFAETVTKSKTGLFASAIDAFDKQKDQVRTDFENMPPGSQIFFSANSGNGGYGHTGVASSPTTFISATNDGVKDLDINKWSKNTGQKVLGYIPPNT